MICVIKSLQSEYSLKFAENADKPQRPSLPFKMEDGPEINDVDDDDFLTAMSVYRMAV